jgi:hypothetical protein
METDYLQLPALIRSRRFFFIVMSALFCSGCAGSYPVDIRKSTLRFFLPTMSITAPKSVRVNETFNVAFAYVGADCAPEFSWGGNDNENLTQNFEVYASDFSEKRTAAECLLPGTFTESLTLAAPGTWTIQYNPSGLSGLVFPAGSVQKIAIQVLPAPSR